MVRLCRGAPDRVHPNRFLDLPVEAVAERLNDVPASVSTTSHDGETWVGDTTSSTEHKESVHTPLTEPFDAFVLTYAIGRIPSQTSGWNTGGWISTQTEAEADHTAAKAYWTTLGYIDRERAKVQKALETLRKGPPGPESRSLALRQAGATLTLASAAEVQAESKLIAAKLPRREGTADTRFQGGSSRGPGVGPEATNGSSTR